MPKFYFVRHGEPDAPKGLRPKTTQGLTQRGREQIAGTSERLPGDIGVIYTSPLLRAQESARIMAWKRPKSMVIIKPFLREIDRPEQFYGAPYDDPDHQKYMWQRKQALYRADTEWLPGPNSESFGGFITRLTFVISWMESLEVAEAIISTHSHVIGLMDPMLRLGIDLSPKRLFYEFRHHYLPYGGILSVEFDQLQKTWRVIRSEMQSR